MQGCSEMREKRHVQAKQQGGYDTFGGGDGALPAYAGLTCCIARPPRPPSTLCEPSHRPHSPFTSTVPHHPLPRPPSTLLRPHLLPHLTPLAPASSVSINTLRPRPLERASRATPTLHPTFPPCPHLLAPSRSTRYATSPSIEAPPPTSRPSGPSAPAPHAPSPHPSRPCDDGRTRKAAARRTLNSARGQGFLSRLFTPHACGLLSQKIVG